VLHLAKQVSIENGSKLDLEIQVRPSLTNARDLSIEVKYGLGADNNSSSRSQQLQQKSIAYPDDTKTTQTTENFILR